MKTKLFILFLLTSTFIFGQQPYHDALKLGKYWDNGLNALDISQDNSNIILPILYQYLDEVQKGKVDKLQKQIKDLEASIPGLIGQAVKNAKEEKTDLEDEVYALIKESFDNINNPFVKLPNSVQSSGVKELGSVVTEGFSSIGGINVTSVADGLAKFLVERAKQELSITFFEKFVDILEDEKNEDFKALFPETYDVLKVIDKEVYQFSNYINTLRESFKKDLENILDELEPFLKKKKLNRYEADRDDPIAQKIEYFESALLIVNSIRQGVHPAEAIGQLEYQQYHSNNKTLNNIKETVKVFNIFSNSLRSTDPDRYWVKPDSLQELLDDDTFKIYLGLLYQLHDDVLIFNTKFGDYINKVSQGVIKIEEYKKYVQDLVLNSQKIVLAVQNIKQKSNNGDKIDSYKEVFQSSIGLLSNFKEVEKLNLGINLDNTDKVWDILELVNEVYLDVNNRKYNALILDLSKLLTEILGSDKFEWKDDLIKYGTFIANVAQADNSDEVKSAIESIALPVGSSSIKKKSKSNIALNAYVGLAPAIERNGDLNKYKFSFGLNAPIGVAFSKGLYKLDEKTNKYEERGSSTWFFSLIDLGAVTTYRFGDSETEKLPEIKLENIFAPGVYYVYGFPKAPISIGLGGQLGPQLREVTNMNTTLDSNLSFSFKLFVAIDIPLLNFHTKSR